MTSTAVSRPSAAIPGEQIQELGPALESTPAVGSSSRSRAGSLTSARARNTRWVSPPDSPSSGASRSPRRPRAPARRGRARARPLSRGTATRRAGRPRPDPRPGREVAGEGLALGHVAHGRAAQGARRGPERSRAAGRARAPPCRNVVLPPPFGPHRHTNSPRPTSKLTPSRTRWPPSSTTTSRAQRARAHPSRSRPWRARDAPDPPARQLLGTRRAGYRVDRVECDARLACERRRELGARAGAR